MIFGRGKKEKRNEEDFVNLLSELAGIERGEAQRFYNANEGFIKKSFSRGLDPFGAVWHISNASMERICAAHEIGELDHIEDIPDYMLLVSLQVAKIMSKQLPADEVEANNKYWNAVIKMPIDPNVPDRTYADRLHELVAEYNRKK